MAANPYHDEQFYSSTAHHIDHPRRLSHAQSSHNPSTAPVYRQVGQQRVNTAFTTSGYPQHSQYSHQQHPASQRDAESSPNYGGTWWDTSRFTGTNSQSQGTAAASSHAVETDLAKGGTAHDAYDTTALGSLAYASGLDHSVARESNPSFVPNPQISTRRPVAIDNYGSTGQSTNTLQAIVPPSYRSPLQSILPAGTTTLGLIQGFNQARSHSSNSNASHAATPFSQHPSPELGVSSNVPISIQNSPQPNPAYYGSSTLDNMTTTISNSTEQLNYSREPSLGRTISHRMQSSGQRTPSVTAITSPKLPVSQAHRVNATASTQANRTGQNRAGLTNARMNNYSQGHKETASQLSHNNSMPRIAGPSSAVNLPNKAWRSGKNLTHGVLPAQDLNRITSPVQLISQIPANDHVIDRRVHMPSYISPQQLRQPTHAASSPYTSAHDLDTASEQTSTMQRPETVNPSQIYNSYHEYRENYAATENLVGARRISESRAMHVEDSRTSTAILEDTEPLHTTIAPVANSQPLTVTPNQARNVPDTLVTATALISSQAVPPTDNMEQHIRLMVEKMREYQAKDPSLFSQAWESVKNNSSQADAQSSSRQASTPPAGTSPVVATIDPHALLSTTDKAGNSLRPGPTLGPTSASKTRSKPTRKSKTNQNPRKRRSQEAFAAEPTVDQVPDRAVRPGMSVAFTPSTSTLPMTIDGNADQTKQSASNPPRRPSISEAQTTNTITLWPQKSKLAVTAAEILTAMHENAGKTIKSESILSLLSPGPTYIELCESLEKMGLVVDRRSLARDLLSVVSKQQLLVHSGTPHPKSSSSSTVSALTTTRGFPISVQKGELNHDVLPPDHSNVYAASQTQTKDSQPHPDTEATIVHFNPSQMRGDLPRNNNRSVVTGESYVSNVPNTGINRGVATNSHSQAIMTLQHSAGDNTASPSLSLNTDTRSDFANIVQQLPTQALRSPSQSEAKKGINRNRSLGPVPTRDPLGPSSRPLSKAEAARKQNLADIVDLTQEHPDYADFDPSPLSEISPQPQINNNHAFYAQLVVPTALADSADSDLFAGGMGKSAGKRNSLRTADVCQPFQYPRDDPATNYNLNTIARDILIASGRHPNLRALNEHLLPLRENFRSVDNRSDLDTFDWQRVDPGGPLIGAAGLNQEQSNYTDATGVFDMAGSKKSSRSTPTPRRGRSKRASEITNVLSSATPVQTSASGAADRRSSVPASAGPSRRFAIEIASKPSTPNSKVGGRRSRKGKNDNTTPPPPSESGTADLVTVDLESRFYCQWRNCSAQTHNLDKLRSHIVRKHTGQQIHGGYACQWLSCGQIHEAKPRPRQPVTVRHDYDFDTAERLMKHVEEAHLEPLARKMGDGPVEAKSVSEDAMEWSSDEEGRALAATAQSSDKDGHDLPQGPQSAVDDWFAQHRLGRSEEGAGMALVERGGSVKAARSLAQRRAALKKLARIEESKAPRKLNSEAAGWKQKGDALRQVEFGWDCGYTFDMDFNDEEEKKRLAAPKSRGNEKKARSGRKPKIGGSRRSSSRV